MNTLENYGVGWSNVFNKRLEYLKTVLPEVRFNSIERFKGMLRINVSAPDEASQYLADCVVYCIERDSARMCENCGKYGLRRMDEELMPEPKCLCLPCYVLEVDNTYAQQNS
jgi:hypothetical protein